MRVGLVRKVGLSMLAVAMAGLTACNDNPLDYNPGDTSRLDVNPSVMVVTAGDTTELQARAVDEGNEPTFDAVNASVDAACVDAGVSTGAITVVDNPDALPIQPPGQFLVLGGLQMGQSCINLSSAGASATVGVTVVGSELTLLSGPEALRAGETGTIDIDFVSATGESVTPFDQSTDVTWTSDNGASVTVDDAGNLEATESGTAVITAEWTGTDATGTSDLGLSRTLEQTIVVGPAVPATAELTIGEPIAAGSSSEFKVFVYDEFGNETRLADEITGVTPTTSDAGVATVTGALVPVGEGEVEVILTVTGVGSGFADISGTVQTTEGDIPFGPTEVEVLNPQFTVAPASGPFATLVTLTGTGLASPNFDTTVLIDGEAIYDFFVQSVSATSITFYAPAVGEGAHDVTVQVGTVESAADTWTQVGDNSLDEPANETAATATTVTFPVDFWGTFTSDETAVEYGHYDIYKFTIATTTTIQFDLAWGGSSDLDVYVWDQSVSAEPDGSFATNGFACGGAGGTSANPESTGECTLEPGDYLLWLYDFGSEYPTTYHIQGQVISVP